MEANQHLCKDITFDDLVDYNKATSLGITSNRMKSFLETLDMTYKLSGKVIKTQPGEFFSKKTLDVESTNLVKDIFARQFHEILLCMRLVIGIQTIMEYSMDVVVRDIVKQIRECVEVV